ncbi:MAG TPA: hypothetical protein VK612_02240 [Pyrinomonadaceae bacterium]|nr:hypothetical protein [Pyrinomonadaceae bacterium]
MNIFKSVVILALFSLLSFIYGCGGNVDPNKASNATSARSNANASAANKANGNAEELGMLINFTLEPEDLTWKADDKKKSIVAVFRLDTEDEKKFEEQLSAKGPGAPREISTEEWFPAELIAQGESGGGSSVEGTAYPADEFYQAPYNQGTITRINGTDFFVIELAAK